MRTSGRGRWLIACVWHNPYATDQMRSVMLAFEQMNRRPTVIASGDFRPWSRRRISEAEAIAIIDKAAEFGPIFGCDKLAKYLGLTYQQRTTLRIRTIGACDFSKGHRKRQRKHKDLMDKARRRCAAGMRPQSQSLSATQPWKELGISRTTWYRQNKAGMRGETVLSAISSDHDCCRQLCVLTYGIKAFGPRFALS